MHPVQTPIAFLLLLAAGTSQADSSTPASCGSSGVCVDKSDLHAFVQLAKDHKCRAETPPTLAVDPIVIVVDQDGRIYGSGSDPKPYKVQIKWCNYDVTATGQVRLNVAVREPPTWGFRFRPKASLGILGVEAFERDRVADAVDVGVLVEPFFYHSWNVNVAVGMRSFGAGIGFDITRNFGGYLGYAAAYSGLRSNPMAGLYFSFW